MGITRQRFPGAMLSVLNEPFAARLLNSDAEGPGGGGAPRPVAPPACALQSGPGRLTSQCFLVLFNAVSMWEGWLSAA